MQTTTLANAIPTTKPKKTPSNLGWFFKKILPEHISSTCKNADELEIAFSLYKNISPYIAFNEDGKPTKVNLLNLLNAPSQGGVTRKQDLKHRFEAFLIDYTAIYNENECNDYIKGEINLERLDSTEKAKEAFVRIRKAVHGEVKKEFEEVYFPPHVKQRIETKMQEREVKNLEIQQLLLEMDKLDPDPIPRDDIPTPRFGLIGASSSTVKTPRFGSGCSDASYLMTFRHIHEEGKGIGQNNATQGRLKFSLEMNNAKKFCDKFSKESSIRPKQFPGQSQRGK
jgi:hypothetical protein